MADNPRFVETLPRRGYRFIAPVQPVGVAIEEAPACVPAIVQVELSATNPVTPRRGLPRAWMLGLLVLFVGLAGFGVWMIGRARHPAPVIRSLAVLPLENLSGDASQDYFSDGMTDELINELGQINELRVISRTSVMTYKGTHKSLPQIARDLNVDAVVEGAVLRSGDQVRITAELILAAAGQTFVGEEL